MFDIEDTDRDRHWRRGGSGPQQQSCGEVNDLMMINPLSLFGISQMQVAAIAQRSWQFDCNVIGNLSSKCFI